MSELQELIIKRKTLQGILQVISEGSKKDRIDEQIKKVETEILVAIDQPQPNIPPNTANDIWAQERFSRNLSDVPTFTGRNAANVTNFIGRLKQLQAIHSDLPRIFC